MIKIFTNIVTAKQIDIFTQISLSSKKKKSRTALASTIGRLYHRLRRKEFTSGVKCLLSLFLELSLKQGCGHTDL